MNRRAFLRNGVWILGAPAVLRAQVRLGSGSVGQSAGAVAAGSGGGTWTFIASATGTGNTAGTTSIATSSSLTVVAGDLLVAYAAGYDSTDAMTGVGVTAGADTFTASPAAFHAFSHARGGFFYKINASGQTSTVTASWTGTSVVQYGVTVFQFRPSQTVTQDTNANGNGIQQTNPVTLSTNAPTSNTKNILALIGSNNNGGDTPNTPLINSIAATGSAGTYDNVAYSTGVANNTTISGSWTSSANDAWVTDLITFKN